MEDKFLVYKSNDNSNYDTLIWSKKDIKNATLQQSIKVISNYAFFCCIHLTQIIIPSSVKSIGCNALNKCSKLTYILIPSSVESFGDRAFSSC